MRKLKLHTWLAYSVGQHGSITSMCKISNNQTYKWTRETKPLVHNPYPGSYKGKEKK